MLKELDEYRQFDAEVSETAMNALGRHLWYLGDELMVVSLFSEQVPSEEKYAIARSLRTYMDSNEMIDRTENSTRYIQELNDIQNLGLPDFISPRSKFLFSLLNIDSAFLLHDASGWNAMADYTRYKNMIKKLLVCVNDSAERELQIGAKLIDEQRVRSESRLQDAIVKIKKLK